MSGFSFGSLANALSRSGVSSNLIPGVVQNFSLTGWGHNAVVSGLLTQMMQNASQPEVVARIANQLEITQGFPPEAVPALEALKAPGVSAAVVLQTVTSIETMTASSHSLWRF